MSHQTLPRSFSDPLPRCLRCLLMPACLQSRFTPLGVLIGEFASIRSICPILPDQVAQIYPRGKPAGCRWQSCSAHCVGFGRCTGLPQPQSTIWAHLWLSTLLQPPLQICWPNLPVILLLFGQLPMLCPPMPPWWLASGGLW
jgi:hypothetical protein